MISVRLNQAKSAFCAGSRQVMDIVRSMHSMVSEHRILGCTVIGLGDINLALIGVSWVSPSATPGLRKFAGGDIPTMMPAQGRQPAVFPVPILRRHAVNNHKPRNTFSAVITPAAS